MKKTGLLLKEKRESANLSLSEVALSTKINPKILSAIENGDEAHLPAKTFLKGFVRSYAVYLKMDVDEVMKCFLEETGGKPIERVNDAYFKPETPQVATPPPGPRRRVADENSSGMRTIAVIAIVILIGLIVVVDEVIKKYQREKVVAASENIKVSPLLQPPAVIDSMNATTPEEAKPASPEVKPEPAKADEANAAAATAEIAKPEPVKAEPVAVKPVPVKVEQPKPEPIKAIVAKPPPTPVAIPTPPPAPPPAPMVKAAPPPPTPTPAPTPALVATPAPEPAANDNSEEPKAVASKGVKNEIILEALDKVDVKMKIKGEIKQMSLTANQVHTIHSDQPVVLDVSDGGAVNIIVNGVERGVPGDLGKPKQISIP